MSELSKAALNDREARSLDAVLYWSSSRAFLGALSGDGALILMDEECKSLEDFRGKYFALPAFALPYRSFSILADNGGVYDLVPSPFLTDEKSLGLWLPALGESEAVHIDDLPSQDCGVVYPVEREFREFASRSFSRQSYHHPVSGLCLAALQLSRKNDEDCLLAMVTGFPESPRLDLAHASRGKLLFAHRFPIYGESDVLYFVTAAWRSEGLDQDKSLLRLYGDRLSPEMTSKIEALRRSVHSFSLNDYEELGAERAGADGFPAPVRLRMLCA